MSNKLVPVRFGEFLVEQNKITEQQLLDSLAEHWMTGCRLGESIVRKGYLPSGEIERLAGEFQGLNTVWV
jgi:hypothetical protein